MSKIMFFCLLFVCFVSVLGAANDSVQDFYAATVEEFLASIGPNRTIVLTAEDFLLPDSLAVETSYYSFIDQWDDAMNFQLVIKNVDNLQIIKKEGAKAHIHSSNNIYNEVIRFENCSGIRLVNLNLGHFYAEHCIGPVLVFSDCSDLVFENVRMYGCGAYGVHFMNVKSATLKYCEITECASGLVSMSDSQDIVFLGCDFKNCMIYSDVNHGGGVRAIKSTRIRFTDCTFRDLVYEYFPILFRFDESDGELHNCQVDGEPRNEAIGTVDSYLRLEALKHLKGVSYKDYDEELGKQVYKGFYHIVELLLERDANPNYVYPETGCSVLQQALYRGNPRIVNLLLNKGADCLYSDPQGRNAAFYAACIYRDTELINKILDKVGYELSAEGGISVGSYAGIYGNSWLCYDLNKKYTSYDLNDDRDRTPFFYAVANHRLEFLKWKYGNWENFPTDTDENGVGLMLYAVASGDTAIVDFFTGMKSAMQQVDGQGNSALLYSILGNIPYRELGMAAMQIRLEYPARIYNEYYEPFQPTLSNPQKNYNAITRLLISKGVDVNQRRKDGLSPLAASVLMNDYEATRILLENGANPYFKFQGKVPLDVAKEKKVDSRIIDLLTKAME